MPTPSEFDSIVRSRETRKVFADPTTPPAIDAGQIDTVWAAIETAAWAPFHYPSHTSHHDQLNSAVPWRFYSLDYLACRKLIAELPDLANAHPDVPPLASVMNGKIPAMLAAAGAMVLVTWLPHPAKGEIATDKLTQMNEEHLMAAAAATQTLLLALTARNVRTYWSSGGALATRPIFDRLGVGANELFAAAIFVWPDEFDGEESVPGKNRDSRGPVETYARRVEL